MLLASVRRLLASEACDACAPTESTYLLHWRGNVPRVETMEAFMAVQQEGKIR